MIFLLLLSISAHASDTPAPVTLAELAGSWKNSCTPQNTGGAAVSQLDFTPGGEVTDTDTLYADNNCQNAYYTIASKLDFSLNAGNLSATATPFDTTLRFETQDGAEAANKAPGTCGLTNWQVGVAQTILGTACAPRDTINLQIGKVGGSSIRLSVCNGGSCHSSDYQRSN